MDAKVVVIFEFDKSILLFCASSLYFFVLICFAFLRCFALFYFDGMKLSTNFQ